VALFLELYFNGAIEVLVYGCFYYWIADNTWQKQYLCAFEIYFNYFL